MRFPISPLRLLAIAPALVVLGFLMYTGTSARASHSGTAQTPRHIEVVARDFAYDPPIIRVQKGETILLTLNAHDVSHGLYLDGYGINMEAYPGKPATATFVASRSGTFHMRCSLVCGRLHPFMTGQLIVEPSRNFPVGASLAGIVALGALSVPLLRRRRPSFPIPAAAEQATGWQVDLTGWSPVRRVLKWRPLPFALMFVTTVFFSIAVLAGLAGSPVGSHNFGIVFVWITWWVLLITVMVPLTGRLWCLACPLPAPGEWLQRLSLFRRRQGRALSLGLRWPRRLRSSWIQVGMFLLMGLFSAIVLTTPRATAWVLLGFVLLAIALSLVFERRVFCRYVCPVGGFIGLYSNAALLAVRVRDPQVCREHREKECLAGSASGYGCPWSEYPGRMEQNAYCGMCMECFKSCSRDNVRLVARPFGRDLLAPARRLDEAYLAFITVGSALLYSAERFGTWGWLKRWAGLESVGGFAGFMALLLGVDLVALPGLHLAVVWLSRRLAGPREVPLRDLLVRYAYALVPVGLMAWVAFSLTFIFTSGAYALPVISDPFGWGWDLFGTAHVQWRPLLTGALPYIQGACLLIGLGWSIHVARRLIERTQRSRRSLLALAPLVVFLLGITLALMKLHLG